jgi:uncharacterized protein YndB with AHSA1/START domain
MRDGDGRDLVRDGHHRLYYERRLDHPAPRVWAALTEPAQLRQWLADAELHLVVGGAVRLTWLNTGDEGETAVAQGSVTELQHERVLELMTDIHGVVRFELTPAEDGTLLVFSVSVPARSRHVPLALAGWHIHLEHLEDALEGRPVDWSRWSEQHRPRWDEHHERYAAQARA